MQQKSLSPRHPNTARTLTALGEVLTAAGRAREAEAPLREALAIRRAAYSSGHPRIEETARASAQCLANGSRRAELR